LIFKILRRKELLTVDLELFLIFRYEKECLLTRIIVFFNRNILDISNDTIVVIILRNHQIHCVSFNQFHFNLIFFSLIFVLILSIFTFHFNDMKENE